MSTSTTQVSSAQTQIRQQKTPEDPIERLKYHLNTLYLFTKSDLPTSIGVNTTFAVAGIAAGPSMVVGADMSWGEMLKGLSVALFFSWHLTLSFNLGNQRQPQSIVEDGINKPWRPIPAGRITPELTKKCQLTSIAILWTLTATTLGAFPNAVFFIFLTWLYNEQAWGDISWWKRDMLCALGMNTNRVGTLIVATTAALGTSNFQFTDKAFGWFLLCGGVVFFTIQVQDLRDQAGDAEINRRTVPLIIGDATCRWVTAALVLAWNFICTAYWGLGLAGSMIPALFGVLQIAHMLTFRTPRSDRWAFRFLGVWWVSLLFVPALKTQGF